MLQIFVGMITIVIVSDVTTTKIEITKHKKPLFLFTYISDFNINVLYRKH